MTVQPQSRPHETYRNPYGTLNQARAIETAQAIWEIELELDLRLDAVQRAALMFVLERFAERWPKERGWP